MYDKLLVAVDESEHANRTVDQACALATLSGGTVQVVHVREHVVRRGTSWYVTEEQDAEGLVDRAVTRLRDQGVEASGVVLLAPQGRVATAIWEQAEAFGADIVVIGSHGKSAVGDILLGSVANRAIHLARAPVLVVR